MAMAPVPVRLPRRPDHGSFPAKIVGISCVPTNIYKHVIHVVKYFVFFCNSYFFITSATIQ
jgi:hypothetical protein